MLILFFMIGILLVISCFVIIKFECGDRNCDIEDTLWGLVIFNFVFGIIVLLGTFIAMCCLLTVNTNNYKKQNHIDMLVEENTRIQEAVDTMVKNYCQHENEVYTELIGDNVMFVITLYPKLASSELVNKQIELYVDNNAEIKKLKAELVYAGTIRFWLYFGN